jgi:hypothetical protein
MLRSSDLVALPIADATHDGEIVAEFATGQKKTRKPVCCNLSEKTRAVPSRQDSGAIWTARDAIAVVIKDLNGK